MIRHHFTFHREAELLNDLYRGATILQCWSQEKNRMVAEVSLDQDSAHFEVSVDPSVGYAIPAEKVRRAKRNTIDLFETVLGTEIEEIFALPSERAIAIRLASDRTMLIPFFGPGSGNVLLVESGSIVENLNDCDDEYNLLVEELEEGGRQLSPASIRDALIDQKGNLETALRKSIPPLGPLLTREALHRSGKSVQTEPATLSERDIDDIMHAVSEVEIECRESNEFNVYRTESEVRFALIRLAEYEKGVRDGSTNIDRFDDLPTAIRRFRASFFRLQRRRQILQPLRKDVEREIKKAQRTLDKTPDLDDYLERAAMWEEHGNVLLARLNDVRKGMKSVTLEDFAGSSVEVKLDPKLSPTENADRLFAKARKSRRERTVKEKRNLELRHRLDRLKGLRDTIDGADSLEQAETIQNAAEEILGRRKRRTHGQQERATPFRTFDVWGETVLVGKHARGNDELTQKIARPDDIWFHARGTSGSHVVLRWNKNRGKPGTNLIERVASIAAWYSGDKHSSLVPVAWTLKKYVRKPKGSAPGAVVMTREEVVIVRPELPGHQSHDA